MLPSPAAELEFKRLDDARSGDVSRAANAIANEFFSPPDDPSKEVSVLQVAVLVAAWCV